MRPATPDEIQRWDELIVANPDGGNVFQTQPFAETKARHGWQSRYFMMGETAVLILARNVPGLGEYWYVPEGPGVTNLERIKEFTKNLYGQKPFVVRIDPLIPKEDIVPAELTKLGFTKSRDIQYNLSTILVDLKPTEDEILASFKQKTRYNVRLAAKKGVTAEPVDATPENVDTFYALAHETYTRAGVYVRSKQYFADYWQLHAQAGKGQMFFARYEGKVLAAVFIIFVGNKALYKDGASSREHSDVQAMAGLQWEVMKWLKAKGIESYDLDGVPPKDQLDNPDHPLAGLARFKTGFNPEVTEYIGTYDLALKPAQYKIWQGIGERVAMSYEFRVKKRLFY